MAAFYDDERVIQWKTIEGIDHLSLSVLDLDESNGVLHVLFRFAANERILLHRHLTLNKTMTLSGEHHLYHADGKLKEVRPAGRFTVAPPSDEPHREGGGEQDAIVLFAIYGSGALYQALDEQLNVVRTLAVQDFAHFYDGGR
ncbi:MAG: regulator [Methylocystis sp.]|uniref:regulator n=1 Tax=Methylocystis sp. TaxID=1911079 RepID=UPI003DA20C99